MRLLRLTLGGKTVVEVAGCGQAGAAAYTWLDAD